MTNNELAIVVFPVVAAVLIGGMVWVVTASAVGRFRARQALRRATVPLSPDDLELKNDVIHTEAGSYFRLSGTERTVLAGIAKLSKGEHYKFAEQETRPGPRRRTDDRK